MISSKCQCYSSITRLTIAFIAMLTLNLFSGSVVYAEAGDEFEGAVWQFGMTPKVRGDVALRGSFRVADDNIFQRNGRDNEKLEKPAGTNFPMGKTASLTSQIEECVQKVNDVRPNPVKLMNCLGGR